MRIIFFVLIYCLYGIRLIAQCYYYELYPSKNRVNDLFGANIVTLNEAAEFVAIGITESALNDVTFYVNEINECGDTLWQQVYDFYPVGGEDPRSAIINQIGNIIIQGTVFDTIEGARDNFILEIDTNGFVVYYKRIDAGFNDMGWDIKQTSDKGYVIGGMYWSTGGLFLVKVDSIGNVLWQKDYELNRVNMLQSIDVTTDGGFVLGGYYYNPNYTNTNFFLIKTDSLGNQLWSKQYGLSSFDETRGYTIATLDGGFLLAGYKVPYPGNSFSKQQPYLVKTDKDGIVEWDSAYTYTPGFHGQFKMVKQLADSSFVLGGYIPDISHPNAPPNVGLYKIDKNGIRLWYRSYSYYGGRTEDYAEDMTIAANGDVAITGYIIPVFVAPYNDMFVLKTDSCGYLENPNIHAAFIFSLDTASQTVTFINRSTEYCTSLWYFGDGDSAYQRNIAHTYPNAGVYSVTLIVRAGNSTDTLTQQITIGTPDSCGYFNNPVINAAFSYGFGAPFTVTFTNESSGYCTLIWHFGDGDSSLQQNPVHTYSDTGTYTITLIVIAGSSSDTVQQEITITKPVGIQIIRHPEIAIYPNPATETIYIAIPATHYPVLITVTDISGKLAQQFATANPRPSESVPCRTSFGGQTTNDKLEQSGNPATAGRQTVFSTQHLAKGLYFVRVELENGKTLVRKVVIQ